MQACRVLRTSSNASKAFVTATQIGGGGGAGGRGRSTKPPPPRATIPPYVWATAGATVTAFGVTYYSYLDEAPLTHRKRWIATSPEWERQAGDHEYQSLLRAYRREILPDSHRASVTLRRVGKRIAEATDRFAAEHGLTYYTNHPYTFTVIRSDMANAFVLPGNHIFLFTGLFRYVRDEDELASVLGHEVAHNLARHVGEKVSGSIVVNMLARLSLLVDPSGVIFAMLLPAASLFRELPNSRTQEMEADQIGLQIAAEACYDPRAARRVFAAMRDGEGHGGAPPEFLSTHPSHDSRLKKFDEWVPQAMTRYEGDAGERCRSIRYQMQMARLAAAQEAAYCEQKSWQ